MNFEKQAGVIGKWGWRIIQGSLLWVMGNAVYVFFILNMLLAENINEVGTLVVTAIILIPFLFSPGTVAAFSCIRNIHNEVDSRSLIQVFKESYKHNYRQSFTSGVIYILGFFLLYTCYWYYGQLAVIGYVVPLILIVLEMLVFLFVLMYISDREEKSITYWKNSILILTRHPMFALFMGTEVFFVLFLCHFNAVLLLLVAPGSAMLIIYHFYHACLQSEVKKAKHI